VENGSRGDPFALLNYAVRMEQIYLLEVPLDVLTTAYKRA
jgi:hypothetical protein